MYVIIELMRIIKYYDRIHRQFIDLEVTDEVAKFLMRNDKWLRRQQIKYNYYTVSLDSPVYNDDEDGVTLAETIEEKYSEEDYYIDEDKKKLFKMVWKIVNKLDDKQQKLINDLFVKEKSQKQIAKEFGVSASGVSQMKDTALLHLRYHFYTDKEFMQTDIYKRNKREFDFDLVQVAKEINKNEYFSIDLNAVANLVKDNTQVLKMLSSLGIDIDEKQKELLSSINRVVKNFIENIDTLKGNFLNVPLNIEIPDDWKNKK